MKVYTIYCDRLSLEDKIKLDEMLRLHCFLPPMWFGGPFIKDSDSLDFYPENDNIDLNTLLKDWNVDFKDTSHEDKIAKQKGCHYRIQL